MVVIDMSTFEKPKRDTPEAYEARCIKFDAERAAKMKESIHRACSWPSKTPQRELWIETYMDARLGHGNG